RLSVEPASFEVGVGSETEVKVRLSTSGARLDHATVALKAPDGWSVSGPTATGGEPGTLQSFRVKAGASAAQDGLARIEAEFHGEVEGHPVAGRNHAFVRLVPPVRASFRALHDIAGYREFARATATEWVIPSLPAR